MTDFRAIGEPIKLRYRFHSTVPDFFSQFESVVQKINSQAAEHPHLTDENRKLVSDKVAAATEFVEKVKADIAAKKLWEDPAFTISDIERQIALVQAETTALFNQPPPKPKAEEKPAEEAPKEGEPTTTGDKPDVEMTENSEAKPEEESKA